MKLKVKYSGYDVDRGRMNALELGPAIFGVGEMVGRTSRILYNDDTRVRVDVRADFQHASFGIEFFAYAVTGHDLLPHLTWEQLAAIAAVLGLNAKDVAKFAKKGVIELFRWQRGRTIDKAERDGDLVTLTIDNSTTTITVNEYNVFVDPTVRDGVKLLVAPLEHEGVSQVSIQTDTDEPEVITRDERRSFMSAPLPEEEVSTDRSTAILEIISISFREGNKWRFSQGAGTFYADILDEDFLNQVTAQREMFASGDALKVEMETQTVRAGRELKFERKIIRVVEHLRAPRGGAQSDLPFIAQDIQEPYEE